MSDMSAKSMEFHQILLGADTAAAVDWARQLIDSGTNPLDFFNGVFTPAMTLVGDKFSRLEIFLPELLRKVFFDYFNFSLGVGNDVLTVYFFRIQNGFGTHFNFFL